MDYGHKVAEMQYSVAARTLWFGLWPSAALQILYGTADVWVSALCCIPMAYGLGAVSGKDTVVRAAWFFGASVGGALLRGGGGPQLGLQQGAFWFGQAQLSRLLDVDG